MKKLMYLLSFIVMTFILLFFMNVYALNGRITIDGVNFRKEPDTKGDNILGSFKKDDIVSIVSKDGNWYKIQNKAGTVGYAHADFIEEVNETNEKVKNTSTENKNDQKVEQKQEEKSEQKVSENNSEIKKINDKENKDKKGKTVKLKTELSIYSLPVYYSNIEKTVKAENEVEILDKMGIWVKIKTKDGYSGWVLQSDLN